MKRTLFLNPPSYDDFDGGAGSRYQATREVWSFWYPTWLCYPAGMIPGARAARLRRARRAAVRHRRVRPRPRLQTLQQPVLPLSVRVALHRPRLPGTLHVLSLAAGDDRAQLPHALAGERLRGGAAHAAA